MITIAGQRLMGVDWVTVSPLIHPWRTILLSFPIVFFALLSLHFLRRVNSGSTIIVCPARFLTTFQVIPGRHNLTKLQIKQKCIKSFNGPVVSAVLGLLLFAASQLLLIIVFKQPDYIFTPVG